MDIDGRLVMFSIWGLGTVAVWGQVLLDAWHERQRYGDARARREFVAMACLFVVALCAALSIGIVLFGDGMSGLRGVLIAGSLGAFFGAGFYLVRAR